MKEVFKFCKNTDDLYCICNNCTRARKKARYIANYKSSKVKRYENALKKQNFLMIERDIKSLQAKKGGKLSDELMKEVI